MVGASRLIVPTEYPQGSELQLIKSVTGKEIAKSTLPVEIGVIVSNVGTVKAIHDAFVEGKPLVERIITISGEKESRTEASRITGDHALAVQHGSM